MNNEKQLNNEGFTLIELLICLAISAFVVIAALSLVNVGTKSYETNNKNAEIQEEVGYVINLVGDNIIAGKMQDSAITTDLTNNNVTIQLGVDAEDKVIFYEASSKKLLIYKNSDITPANPLGTDAENHLISDNVTSFSAQYEMTSTSAVPGDKSKLVSVNLTIDRKGKTASSNHLYEMRN